MRFGLIVVVSIVLGFVPGRSGGAELEGTSPNDFLRRGLLTFVVGTAGDDRSDREIRRQAELIHSV